MSDTVLKIFPIDREFVPTDERKREAFSLFEEQFSDGEMHEARCLSILSSLTKARIWELLSAQRAIRRLYWTISLRATPE
jgi:hypothetical protein